MVLLQRSHNVVHTFCIEQKSHEIIINKIYMIAADSIKTDSVKFSSSLLKES